MKLVRYTSNIGTNVVLHVDRGRKYTKIMYMGCPPRVVKVLNDEERKMAEIVPDAKHTVERFIEFIRERYTGTKVISQETADILGIEMPDFKTEEEV